MYCTIRISKEVREKLKRLGKKSDTYDNIIEKFFAHVNSCDTFWGDYIN